MSVEWMLLLATVLGILGAAVTYAYQRRVDRQVALFEIRRIAYRNYLNTFMAMAFRPEGGEEARQRLFLSEVELLVVGSDEVVQKVGGLSRFYVETNEDRFNRDAAMVRRLVADVCRAMRANCFEKSDLTPEEVQALVPIA